MSEARRYRLDTSAQRFGTTVIGGSPLRLFRLTAAGARIVDQLSGGQPVPESPLIDRLLDAGVIHPRHDDPTPFTERDVTVVVPTLGEPRYTPNGAVVVDDASDPPVAGAAVRLRANAGPATARNAGLATVTTPLVAFVDADVDVPAGWLTPLLTHFADPRVAAVAPRIAARGPAGLMASYERHHSPLDMGPEPARVRAGTRVSYLPAAALVCRTDVVREIGGFDRAMRVGEDVDLVWRLDEAGWRVRYEPASVVEHDIRGSWPAWFRQRIAYGASAGPLAVGHPGKLAPLRMSGWSVGAWLAVALGRPVVGTAIGVASAAALVPKLPDVPPSAAFRFAAMGNLRAGQQLAHAVRRTWWPLIALFAVRSKSARRVLAVSFLAAGDPRVAADDVAYSIGVWRGMVGARTIGPILPHLTSWPGSEAWSRPRCGSPGGGATAR